MRPIDRGLAPSGGFNEYRQAFPELEKRLGSYCSYCERRLETHLAVEHVQAKSVNPALALSWDNFLLGCCNCNSCKGHTPVVIANYLWPDLNNTQLAFTYAGGQVCCAFAPDHPAHAQACALIMLVGLDKDPGHPDPAGRPANTDKRWERRREIYDKVRHFRQLLQRNDSTAMRETLIDNAMGWGGFGIWFEVFQDDADMCLRLIKAFPGTAVACFDNHVPIPRQGALV